MMRIGFVGTGIMGAPMVLNLLKAGYRVKVWNRSVAKAQQLQDAGAEVCERLAEVGMDVDILICMLSDAQTCDEILFQSQGAVSQLKYNALVIVMSSIPVEVAQAQYAQCKALGLRYLDAPVSGGAKGAIEAKLAIMVGGEQQDFNEAEAIFSSLGRAVLVGPAGCGELSKLVNQMIVASTIATVSEGLLLAQQGGADPAKVKQAISGGFADSPILQQHGQRMIDQAFQPGGAATTQFKDTHTALNYAKSLGLKLPVLGLVNQLFAHLVEAGDGNLDHSSLIRQIQRINQLELGS